MAQDVPLAVLLTVLIPVLTVALLILIRRAVPLQRLVQTSIDWVGTLVCGQVDGAAVIRLYRAQSTEFRRYAGANDELADRARRAGMVTTAMLPICVTLTNVFSVVLVWFGAARVADGRMRVGSLIAFLGYLTLVLVAVSSSVFALTSMPRAGAAARRILELTTAAAAVGGAAGRAGAPDDDVTPGPGPAGMAFESVGFRYVGAVRADRRGRFDGQRQEHAAEARGGIALLHQRHGARGRNDVGLVSQGERQLLSIARAFLVDPPILVLDEATSFVDARTEALIRAATKDLTEGRTSFVIAHRLSTVREADVIVVMEDGQIVESGTHDDLLDVDGWYRELCRAQSVPGRASPDGVGGRAVRVAGPVRPPGAPAPEEHRR